VISRRSVVVLPLAVALSSCASAAIDAGPYKVGKTSITLRRQWSNITSLMPGLERGVRVLSIDGPYLNRLYIASDIREDRSLLRPQDRDTPRPTYRADMSDTELVEFVVDCIAQEYHDPEASGLRPQALGGIPGVRFDIAARTDAGLNMSGTALVARGPNDRLHALIFLAPNEHYYAALLPDVEAIFASATLES
jgi:hypothetical protein